MPTRTQSEGWINYIGAGKFHPDFGYREYWPDAGPNGYGIPVNTILPTDSVSLVPVTIGEWINPGQDSNQFWPLPAKVFVEAPSDSHLLVLDGRPRQDVLAPNGEIIQVGCKIYELLNAEKSGNGWLGSAGAEFDLLKDLSLPAGWTSSDAAGLPVTAGLIRCEDITKGKIAHALRFTIQKSGDAYIAPASHCAPTAPQNERSIAPPLGARLVMTDTYYNQLMSSDIDPQAKIIVQALYEYGAFLADNGSNWYFSGARYDDASKDCFSSDALNDLKTIQMNTQNFRFVDTGDPLVSKQCWDGYGS